MPETKSTEAPKLVGSKGEAETLYISPYYESSYQFPYNPDPLASGNNYNIYDEMLEDDQVKIALEAKKDFVINTGWRVVVDEGKNEEGAIEKSDKAGEIEQFVTECLKSIGDTEDLDLTFDDALRDILSAYAYGFSLTEPVYTLEDAEGGQKYRYARLLTRPPHTFRFDIDVKGKIKKVIQSGSGGDRDYDPSLFLHFIYQPEFGNPYGRSDLRAAHAAWKAKKFVLRFFARHLERFGSPTIIGRYDPSMDANQVARFHAMLQTLQNGTVLTIADGAQLEFMAQQHDAGASFIAALNFYNMQISRAILVPDLLGIGGKQTEGGSFSLGQEHFNLFLGLIKKDRESLQRKITTKLVRPLVLANFGDYRCNFEFIPYSDKQDSELVRVWMEAVKGKIFKANPEEVNHLRKLAGMPEGPVIDPPEPEPLVAGGEDAEEGGKPKSFAMRLSRELNQYEKKVDFKAVAAFRERQEESLERRLRAAGKVIWLDWLDQVKSSSIYARKDIEHLNRIESKFLKDMNAVIRNHFTDLYRESYQMARREVFPDGDKKFSETELPLEAFLKIIKAEAFSMVGDYNVLITKKARNLIIQGLKEGVPAGDLFRAVREAMGEESDKWIQTVISTKTTEFYNRARKSYWDNDPLASQIVVAYEYSAVLDDRTTDICSGLDGKIFDKGGNIPTPPLHFNAIPEGQLVSCRSGEKPVEDVRIGDEVWTHRGRWARVYDVMGKANDDFDYYLELATDDGYLRCTPDHPVLARGRWVAAGALEVGSEVFKPRQNRLSRVFLAQTRLDESRQRSPGPHGERRRFALGAVGNPESSEAVCQRIHAGEAKRAGYGPQRLALSEMALADHGIENGGVVGIHEHDNTISTVVRSIRRIPYLGMVFNLAVEYDESYVVNGHIVHNCRSDLIPVTVFEEYKASKNPTPEDLADMGAGKAFVVPKF